MRGTKVEGRAENGKMKMENGEEGEGERRRHGSEYGSVENSRPMISANTCFVNSFYSTSI
jgi:hypothetical protein